MATIDIDQVTERSAIAAGVIALAADASFLVFSAVGEPFGSINDVGNACFGILAGGLAWALRSRTGRLPAVAAVLGAGVVVAGSGLVLSGATGWLLAGFVAGAGLGLIGPSVILSSRSLRNEGLLSPRVALVGEVAGWLMVLGLSSVVPSAMRLDDAATAPAWAWLTFIGWLGAFVLYPAWSIALGRAAARRSRGVPVRA